LSDRDAGLVTELVYGYCRLKGRLDALLSRFLDPSRRLPAEAMLALGLAAHEIIHLDRVPVYASVNWAVDWAKGYTRAHLSGLFNAVLRRVADMADAARTVTPYKDGAKDEAEVLSRYYSCPEWIVRMWLKEYPKEDAARYLKAQARPPAMGLAVDAAPLGDEAAMALSRRLGAHPACLGRQGLGLAFQPGTGLSTLIEDLALTDAERAALYRQGFAARQALAALNPQRWASPVWDACSGRGGKTRLILEAEFPWCSPATPIWAACAPCAASWPRRRTPGGCSCSAPGPMSRRLWPQRRVPSCSTRPAPAWARSRAGRTSSGSGSLRTWPPWPAPRPRCSRAPLPPWLQAGSSTTSPAPCPPRRTSARTAGSWSRNPEARLAASWTTPPDVASGEFFYAASLQKIG